MSTGSTPPTNGREAAAARERTEAKLRQQRVKGRMIDRIIDSLRDVAEENNFTHRIAKLYREQT